MTFRLPSQVRMLIEDVYRRHDGIRLESREDPPPSTRSLSRLSEILRSDLAVALVVHEERGSRNYNPFEAELLRRMIGTGEGLAPGSVAVITPHRAQRAYLTDLLGAEPSIAGAIDTVERFQGGEQDTVVVAGTESDPYAIGAAADFILNLNRANVAFSRAKRKLVVVVAQTLLDHVPPDLEAYHSAVLWKTLRNLCRRELMRGEIEGTAFRVLTLEP
jgi:superfamily I DNA and/or RNA helicase